MICPPDHKHGLTGTCRIHHKCECGPCRSAHAARERRRTRLKAYGRYDKGLVPAGPVREHVLQLRAAGMGYKTIAHRAGVSVTGVRTLIYGREDYQAGVKGPRHGEQPKQVGREKAERILAVQPSLDTLPAVAHVPAWPYMRRVQALVAMGWSISAVCRHLDVTSSNFRAFREYGKGGSRAHRVKIRVSTARAIIRVYDDLSNRFPPEGTKWEKITAARARTYARERGWPMPMDWEAADNRFDRVVPVRRSAA